MISRRILRRLLWLLWIGDAACLAASRSSSKSQIRRVISTKKNGGHSRTFDFGRTQSSQQQPPRPALQLSSIRHNIASGLRSTFLPSGFPSKTPHGYLQYSIWSWIQDLSTQLRSVLATQRVLQGVGVGREGATALSALLNFIVRDGCGMLATLAFTSIAAPSFPADIKRWRLWADAMVDVGITLEVLSVQLPSVLFLPMICLGNMCKAVCGVAAGACGGAIQLHWAKGSDLSDIHAKFGAQHTVTASLGLIVAALFAKSVSNVPPTVLWILYSALTLLHIVANRRMLRLLALDSLNTVRLQIAVRDFLQQQPIPTPRQMAQREPLWFGGLGRRQRVSSMPIHFGVSFNEFVHQSGQSTEELTRLLEQKHDDGTGYWIAAGPSCVVVALAAHITPTQQTKAYFHALLLAWQLEQQHAVTAAEKQVVQDAVAAELNEAWQAFDPQCRHAGWDLTASELQTRGYEIVLES